MSLTPSTGMPPLKRSVQINLSLIFGLFFLLNVLVFVLALWAAFGHKAILVPEDLSTGWRLLILITGAAISWLAGRWLFLQMVQGELGVDESANASFLMLGYLLLVFLGVAMLAAYSWIFQLLLLLVLVMITLLSLRRIIGQGMALGVMAACTAIGIAVFLLFR